MEVDTVPKTCTFQVLHMFTDILIQSLEERDDHLSLPIRDEGDHVSNR